jgi:D-tyrosyl-tRNA(Tyr) deacylase
MRALIQRVLWAEVELGGEVVGRIEAGLLVYLGVARGDDPSRACWLAEKVSMMRIFEDQQGKMNMTVQDVRGGVLAVPNFTLLADARKGRRPAFTAAAPPEIAKPLFEAFAKALHQTGLPVALGVFGGDMTIRSAADGPVNIVLDSLAGGGGPPTT